MKLLVTIVLALLLHVLLGWAWTMGAGVVAGLWQGPGGWRTGGLGVGLSWFLLIAYSLIVAPGPVGRMAETLGGILGGLPGFTIFIVTLLIGVLLGTVGGGLGTQVSFLLRRRDTVENPYQ